jgi:mono/diheme cytochrome c family protein
LTQKSIFLGALTLAAAASAMGAVTVPGEVTFSKDIAPIFQRSCQNCHQPDGVAPMSLITYKDARPWAKSIKAKTGLRDKAGSMPPWYVEKNIGIQKFKDDNSLSDLELAKIAKWVDSGAPEGDPRDLPPAKPVTDNTKWTLGQPDLVVKSQDVTVKAGAPDYWGELESMPTGLKEDRWVKSVEIREENDVPPQADGGRKTVGSRFVFHHLIWTTVVPGQGLSLEDLGEGSSGTWPVHEVGRNADVFPDSAGKLLRANSSIVYLSAHLHANGRDTKSHLLYGFTFFPRGYEPEFRYARRALGNGVDMDIRGGEGNQRLDAYQVLEQPTKITSYEPHMHAPGVRMCFEAIWGYNVQTLNCTGYDHNWVRVYEYDDDYAPLLPKGTILHIIGYFDQTGANKNVPDPRNWSGSGNRSITNMFIDLGQGLALTEDQFQAEMKRRRDKFKWTPNEVVIGCPLCNGEPLAPGKPKTAAPASSGTGTGGN